MSKRREDLRNLRDCWEKFINRFSLRWTRWGKFKKLSILLFAFFLSLFIIFWISSAALFSLPVITAVYFCTWIVKNIIDIIANWRWGNIFFSSRCSEGESKASEATSQVLLPIHKAEENKEAKGTKEGQVLRAEKVVKELSFRF